jgi:hypothetical protein
LALAAAPAAKPANAPPGTLVVELVSDLEGVRGAEGERVAELLPVPTVETLALALAEGVADREAVRLPLGGREPVAAAVGTAELLGEAEEEGELVGVEAELGVCPGEAVGVVQAVALAEREGLPE